MLFMQTSMKLHLSEKHTCEVALLYVIKVLFLASIILKSNLKAITQLLNEKNNCLSAMLNGKVGYNYKLEQ